MKRLWLIVATLALVGGGCVPYYYGPSYYGYSSYGPSSYGPYSQPYRYYRPPAVAVDPGLLLFYPNLYRGYGYRGYGYRGYGYRGYGYRGYGYRGYYPRHGGRW